MALVKRYNYKLYQPWVGPIMFKQVTQEASEKRWSRSEVVRAAIDYARSIDLTAWHANEFVQQREAKLNQVLNVVAVTKEQYDWIKTFPTHAYGIRFALWVYFNNSKQGEQA